MIWRRTLPTMMQSSAARARVRWIEQEGRFVEDPDVRQMGKQECQQSLDEMTPVEHQEDIAGEAEQHSEEENYRPDCSNGQG